MLRLGSLFSGSGGFELAATLCGIEPRWASEIEPYPIAVTRSRFPDMEHLGSVTEIHGGKIKPVDVITFGAPCQDLSVAGKRAGLRHGDLGDEETTRSGLFMEAVRIIKEMREATNGEYPKFCIYENVPGAFSSSKGEDWRIVLEELIKIVEPGAVMPPVPKNGWPYADSYCGDGWSLAYRVLDAQHWGVPQRRRRVFLTLDLTGQRARAIQFEREGLRGHFETFRTAGQEITGDAVCGIETADCEAVGVNGDIAGTRLFQPMSLRDENWCESDTRNALRAGESKSSHVVIQPVVVEAAGFCPEQSAKTRGVGFEEEVSPTLRAGVTPAIVEQYLFENHSQDSRYRGPLEVCPMLPAQLGTGGNNQPFVVHTEALSIGNGQLNQISMSEVCNTLDCMHDKQAVIVFDKEVYQSGVNATGGHYIAEGGPAPTLQTTGHPPGVCHGVDCRNLTEHEELYPTLQAKPNGGQSLNYSGAVRIEYLVRRLTPTECARLQGFPDFWGIPDPREDFTDEEYEFWLNVRNTHAAINGKAVKSYTKPQMVNWYNKLHTDSAEYRLWGNGVALPCVVYIMQGIADALNNN